MATNAHGQQAHGWDRLLLALTPRRHSGWQGAHGRRWWQRRRDINHLLRLLKDANPTREADIIRQFRVTTELETMLNKLEPRTAPRHLMDIRGR